MPLPTSQPIVFRHAAEWFHRSRAALLEEIPCGKGCFGCCIGPFAITRLDARELQRGLITLTAFQRESIRLRAQAQALSIDEAYPRLRTSSCLDEWADSDIDRLVEQFGDVPCPALQPDGSCGVYPFRPVTCRTMGIPVETNGMVEGACQLQTAVPLLRVPQSLRADEKRLAAEEAHELIRLSSQTAVRTDEVLLPYGFLAERVQ